MRITLIVSTYNWPSALRRVLDGVRRQTVMPDEVIVADDGSGTETRELLEAARATFPCPLLHVWHEDRGFRKTEILNKAVARSSGDYLVQIDGDIVPERHFIEDHADFAQRGCFVCGSRIKLSEADSKRVIGRGIGTLRPWNMSLGHVANAVRSRSLRNWLAFRYATKTAGRKVRGCNMAFWKADLIRVNGFNEDFSGWGQEDSELAYRLYFSGVRKKFLKGGAICYHLHHKERSRDMVDHNTGERQKIIDGRVSWCENGLDKYLRAEP